MEEKTTHYTYPEEGEVLLIDKDLFWTSFDIVKKIKVVLYKAFRIRKMIVGHAGTLDPLATGLVIVCTSKQTKRIQDFQDTEKEYLAKIEIGATTPSFDLETPVDHHYPSDHITKKMVEEALESFKGPQEQVPPLFSAKNLQGKRAYEYARKGEDIKLQPNKVHFYELSLINFELPVVEIKVICSKGTYIRALARDLGKTLNSGAHLTALRRTRIGNNKVEDALRIEDFEEEIKRKTNIA